MALSIPEAFKSNKQPETPVNGTIQAVDVPVGVAVRTADRVRPLVDPLRDARTREPHIAKLRAELTKELKQAEVRGAKVRNEVVENLQPFLTKTRNRVEAEIRELGKRVGARS